MRKNRLIDNSNDFEKILRKLSKNWHIYALSLIIAFGLAFVYNKLSVKIYKAGAQLIVHDNDRNSIDPTRFLRGYELFSARNNFENQLIVLRSSPNVYDAIKKLNLSISYFVKDKFRLTEVYKTSPFVVVFDKEYPQAVDIMFKIKVLKNDEFQLTAKDEDVSIYRFSEHKVLYELEEFEINKKYKFGENIRHKHFNFKIIANNLEDKSSKKVKEVYFRLNSLPELVSQVQSSLKIDPISLESTAVNISLQGSDIEKLIDIMNSLLGSYIQENLDKKNRIAENTISYIDVQLGEVYDSLQSSENILQTFRASNQVMDINLKTERVYEQMRELEIEKARLEINSKYYGYIKEYFEKNDDISDLVVPSSIGIEDQLLNTLIQELITLNAERNSLINNNQQRNPYLRSIEIKIKNIKNTIIENINYIENTSNLSLDDINKRMNNLRGEIRKLPGTQRELIGFERQFRLNDAIYTYLMEKRADAQIAKASSLSDYEIVEPASIIIKVSPKKARNYILACFLGIFFPSIFLLLFDLIKDDIQSKYDIKKATKIPLIGEIIHNTSKTNLIFHKDAANTITAESFRALKANLKYFIKGKEQQVILVTSTIGNEGKTFCALNIASSFAFSNIKTLLLEFDLRLPKLNEYLNIKNESGISTYLANEVNLDDIILKTEIEYLDFIPAGTTPPNPSELISSEKTQELFEKLKEKYEYIIIDTPPIGVISDAHQLIDYADIKIYVVRQNYTPRHIFKPSIQDLETKVSMNIGIVLNDVKVNKRDSAYGYGYKYYINKTERQKGFKYKIFNRHKKNT